MCRASAAVPHGFFTAQWRMYAVEEYGSVRTVMIFELTTHKNILTCMKGEHVKKYSLSWISQPAF